MGSAAAGIPDARNEKACTSLNGVCKTALRWSHDAIVYTGLNFLDVAESVETKLGAGNNSGFARMQVVSAQILSVQWCSHAGILLT